jgi:hypothetical protein
MLTLMRTKPVITFALLLAFCSRCADESLDPNATIAFRLKSIRAMAGMITIDQAYIRLSRIEANGGLQNERTTNLVHSISSEEPPFQLNDSSSRKVNMRLPPALYDQLAFNLVLSDDDYQLVVDAPPANAPDPSDTDAGQDQPAGNTGDDSGSNGNTGANNGADDGTNAGDDDHNSSDDGGDADHPGQKHKGKHDKDHKDHGHKGHRTSDNESSGSLDLDDFFHNAKPAMLVTGTYDNNGKTIRFIFAGSDIGILSVPARQGDSPTVIVGNQSVSDMTFDPERWFSSLTPANIESGTTQIYQGQPVLFIHPRFNRALYEALMPHIQESADLNFQTE